MNRNHEPSEAQREPDAALEMPAAKAPTSAKAERDEAFEALLVAAARAQQATGAPRRDPIPIPGD